MRPLRQALRPLAQRTGARRQLQRLPGQALAIGTLQIFQQNSPGHAVDHQMMGRQQQALAAVFKVHQQGAQQAAAVQAQAALRLVDQAIEVGGAHLMPLPQ
ncbi:hypothetical protein D3C79_877780 [compost metagenome]